MVERDTSWLTKSQLKWLAVYRMLAASGLVAPENPYGGLDIKDDDIELDKLNEIFNQIKDVDFDRRVTLTMIRFAKWRWRHD